ncbi:hypothetical protein GCM10010121_042810 [Streptomyces brasiliensis]|uniref:Uncharacterized protein n=1 Tax=Streptomyces brasiliensis TaxID=1954 RepID=A0A917KU16_9ACTN|nr:hypothetical protein GCM10010121_042810 [Streptomyces brasiliensis]
MGRAVAGLAVRMDVQVGEVAGAQGDEMAVRLQVRLEVAHGLAVLRHAQGELGGPARDQVSVQRDPVVVDTGGAGVADVVLGPVAVRSVPRASPSPSPGGEVGEDPVSRRPGQVDGRGPGAVVRADGVQMTVDGQISRGDDQVQFLAVLRLVRGDRAARRIAYDREAQVGVPAGRDGLRLQDQSKA